MFTYLLRRLLLAIPVVVGVATLVFFLIHMVPGDPVEIMLGDSALPAQREELRSKLHLDQPLTDQYLRYAGGILTGDWGTSLVTQEPVLQRIARAFPATLKLSLMALLVALIIALPTGLFAAARKDSMLDTSAMAGSMVGLSMPAFWLGPLLILFFSFYLRWLPSSGSEEPLAIILPALTLGTGMAALLTRMTRASVLDVLQEDFVRTARAKGLSVSNIWWKHILRNALLPVVTIIGLQAGALLSGSIITEKIFSWPGLGLELVEAIEQRDYPVVQGVVLVIAISYVLINLLTDLVYAWVDPRIRITTSRKS